MEIPVCGNINKRAWYWVALFVDFIGYVGGGDIIRAGVFEFRTVFLFVSMKNCGVLYCFSYSHDGWYTLLILVIKSLRQITACVDTPSDGLCRGCTYKFQCIYLAPTVRAERVRLLFKGAKERIFVCARLEICLGIVLRIRSYELAL